MGDEDEGARRLLSAFSKSGEGGLRFKGRAVMNSRCWEVGRPQLSPRDEFFESGALTKSNEGLPQN